MKHPSLPATMLCLALTGQVFGAKVIPNNAIADLVLGQTVFTSNTALTPVSSFSLNHPVSVAVDPLSRKVFVADRNNNRVLRYPSAAALANGAGAEAVFGQARFGSGTGSGGDWGLNSPISLFFDRFGRLWVADTDNNRILMFEAASYRNTQAYADRVFGQPNFTTVTAGTTADKMSLPYGVCVDTNDRLWVSDYFNNRVLRFDSISTKPSGSAADGVLGQVNFTTAIAGTGSSGIQGPLGITVSAGGALFVTCNSANRVLRFDNAAALGNGSGAAVVLGQTDFSGTAPGLSATQFSSPYGVWITPDDALWVCEISNNRVLRFDHASLKSNGAAANGVVGQPGFATNTANTTNRGLNSPGFQPYVDATGSLWVTDYGNNRVLRFPPDITKPTLVVTGTVPKSTSKTKITIKGTANDTYGISKVQYQIGSGALKTATGTTAWQFTASLAPGSNKITIFAVDSVGNKSISKVFKVKRTSGVAPLTLALGD